MAERRPIVIAGAGIGGLTAALALASHGQRVVVCERSDKLSEIGAGIQLSPNVGRIFHQLGLNAAITAAASHPESMEIRAGPSGRLLSSIPLARLHKRYGHPWRVIARAELQAVLAAAVAAEPMIELRLGTRIVDFAGGRDHLLIGAEARAGRDIQPAAALVAADGVHSELRAKLPGSHTAQPIGRTAWRATLPARAVGGVVAPSRIGLWLGPDAHLVHYPIAGGRTINIVAIVAEDWHAAGWSEPGNHYWLAERFTRWAPAARRIVSAPGEWRKWAILSVDPAGPWVSDRVGLLGDAAHAMPPFLAQGAASAIEDAVVLAKCLAAEPDRPSAALKSYEAKRKPRVSRIHAAASETGERYHYSQPMAAIRNLALRLVGRQLAITKNDWIYGWDPSA